MIANNEVGQVQVRHVQPQSFTAHRHSNVLKVNMKTSLMAEVNQTTRRSNYGSR